MSFFASVLRAAYKLSGAKKAFTLPEDEILTVIEKQNRSRGVFTPKDHKAHYEMITVNGFPCLIVRERPQPSKRAIYSADEVLYGALPDFEEACRRANVPYTAFGGRAWCTATACCRTSRRRGRTSPKSRKYSEAR